MAEKEWAATPTKHLRQDQRSKILCGFLQEGELEKVTIILEHFKGANINCVTYCLCGLQPSLSV